MSTETVERLYEEIMELDEGERAELRDRIGRLIGERAEAEALRDEFHRRFDGHRLGERKAIPWDDARAILRASA